MEMLERGMPAVVNEYVAAVLEEVLTPVDERVMLTAEFQELPASRET
jgi:hypothetical protein